MVRELTCVVVDVCYNFQADKLCKRAQLSLIILALCSTQFPHNTYVITDQTHSYLIRCKLCKTRISSKAYYIFKIFALDFSVIISY